jgi:hypothetical protein
MSLMKFKQLSVSVTLFVSTSIANAMPVGWQDNGSFTTDTNNQLDWLDLSFTRGVSYNDVATNFNTYDGGGWRYATNKEVEDLFNTFFPVFTPNKTSGISNLQSGDSGFSTAVSQASLFENLFTSYFVDQQYAGDYAGTWGFYMDGSGSIRLMGSAIGYEMSCATCPQWVETTPVDAGSTWASGNPYAGFGTYLVRDKNLSAVPVPAAVWLFGSGLLGLVGVARRKQSA